MITFRKHRSRGFSLIELMVTIAVVFVLVAIAVPSYREYIRESTIATATANANTLRVPLEDYRLDNGTYIVAGDTSYTEAELLTNFDWSPEGDKNAYTYAVTVTSVSWDVTVQHLNGVWVRCENRMDRCCNSTSGGGAVLSNCNFP